jgi:hypothetical protein
MIGNHAVFITQQALEELNGVAILFAESLDQIGFIQNNEE